MLTSAGFLMAAAVFAAFAGLAPVSPEWRLRLVAAEIAALAAWLGLAVVGHANKIVPFMAYRSLRARGEHRGPTRKPLLFTDPYNHMVVAQIVFATATAGFGALTGTAGTANLATGPRWVVTSRSSP